VLNVIILLSSILVYKIGVVEFPTVGWRSCFYLSRLGLVRLKVFIIVWVKFGYL